MKTVVVEGWRFLPHSYAVVNQYQCLEMLKRPDLTLYHRDVPLYQPNWKPALGSMSPEHEAALQAIPAPPPGLKADALLRMGFPHFFENAPDAARTFTWVTSEFKRIGDSQIGNGKKPWEALSKAQSTVVACSNWAAQGFLNSGLPKSKVVVVPCGVDTSIFHPLEPEARAELRRKLGWEGRFVGLNVSGGMNNKGIDLIYRAAGELAERHPELLISLKGSDTLYMSDQYVAHSFSLIPKAARELLRDRITYQGGVLSAPDMAKLYQAADIYLTPYRAEGFNLPVLEAAACGLPVICTKGGSTDDFADDSWALRMEGKETNLGPLGWQIEPNFPAFRSHFERALTDRSWRESAAAAGAQWVRDKFTWKHSVDKLLKLMLP